MSRKAVRELMKKEMDKKVKKPIKPLVDSDSEEDNDDSVKEALTKLELKMKEENKSVSSATNGASASHRASAKAREQSDISEKKEERTEEKKTEEREEYQTPPKRSEPEEPKAPVKKLILKEKEEERSSTNGVSATHRASDKEEKKYKYVESESEEEDSDNPFDDISEKTIVKLLKRENVANVSKCIYTAITQIFLDFTTMIIKDISYNVNPIDSKHVRTIMDLYIENEDEELQDLAVPPEVFERAVKEIVKHEECGIKRDAVLTLQLFVECIIGKMIRGAQIISESNKRNRCTGKDMICAFEVYLL